MSFKHVAWVWFTCALCACGGRGASQAEAENAPVVHALQPPLGKGTPAQNLVNASLALHMKLASDDAAGARSAFAGVRSAAQVSALDLALALRQRIDAAAQSGAASADLAHARTAFIALSSALLDWFKVQSNPLPTTVAVTFCPMADGGKGARWLQLGDKIENPFFGGEMRTCGEVEHSLKPGEKL